MITIDANEYFLDFGDDGEVADFISGMIRLRAGIVMDPGVAEPWVCDASLCRPVMGRNLCCKVDTRCSHFTGTLCGIHETKPYSCALFPLDLWRVGGLRVVVSAKNPIPYAKDWSRYDRDMLRCFENQPLKGPSMLTVQLPVLAKAFTRAELALLEEAVGALRN